MTRRSSWQIKLILILGMIGAVTALGLPKGSPGTVQAGGPRLISIEPLPELDGAMCAWPAAGATLRLAATRQQGEVSASVQTGPAPDEATRLAAAQRKPLRMIRDPYPGYSSVAVDPVRNEVAFTDENLFQILVYDRTANTPRTAAFTEPKRTIGGVKTKLEFQCAIYIDPVSGDIYSVPNDIMDTTVVFSNQDKGNVAPKRELYTPHGTFGIAVDEGTQEMYLTVEHVNSVVVYEKTAEKHDSPIRHIQGDRTGLMDPHGIAVDAQRKLMFVANHGSFHSERLVGDPSRTQTIARALDKKNWPRANPVVGSGKNLPPSITIHALDAQGNAAPLRTITGPNTQLNWPTGLAADPDRGELYVANDMGDSILVFNSATANGNVSPTRVLKGPKTQIKNPTAVALDLKNDELWVTNFGTHAATVYKASTAAGDIPPLRAIRSGVEGRPSLGIGNPGSVAYDTKREEILAPN